LQTELHPFRNAILEENEKDKAIVNGENSRRVKEGTL
jgi:hypothetical protein